MFGSAYAVKFTTRFLVVAMFVLSLDLLIGVTGLMSFGHAMFFGLGAYALYFLSSTSEASNALVAFPAAMLLAGVAAAAVGAVAVLTRGFYFIMVTLAFGQMLYSLFFDTKIAGGSDGAYSTSSRRSRWRGRCSISIIGSPSSMSASRSWSSSMRRFS